MIITENFKNALKETDIGPRGYVIITDKKGNILVDQHNMILKAGRDLIFDLFANAHKIEETVGNNTTASKTWPADVITSAVFTNETSEPKFGEDNIPTIASSNGLVRLSVAFNDKLSKVFKESASSNNSETNYVDITKGTLDDHNFLVFSFSIPGDTFSTNTAQYKPPLGTSGTAASADQAVYAVSTLYLALGEGSKAFSKVVFDAIPVVGLEELAINYYIYF